MYHGFSFSMGNHYVDIFYFHRLNVFVRYNGFGLYTTALMVCNLRYESSLVVASCNSILLNETCAKASSRHVREKIEFEF